MNTTYSQAPIVDLTVSEGERVPCDTAGCTLPHGYVRDGYLIVESRHYGQIHTKRYRLHILDKEG